MVKKIHFFYFIFIASLLIEILWNEATQYVAKHTPEAPKGSVAPPSGTPGWPSLPTFSTVALRWWNLRCRGPAALRLAWLQLSAQDLFLELMESVPSICSWGGRVWLSMKLLLWHSGLRQAGSSRPASSRTGNQVNSFYSLRSAQGEADPLPPTQTRQVFGELGGVRPPQQAWASVSAAQIHNSLWFIITQRLRWRHCGRDHKNCRLINVLPVAGEPGASETSATSLYLVSLSVWRPHFEAFVFVCSLLTSPEISSVLRWIHLLQGVIVVFITPLLLLFPLLNFGLEAFHIAKLPEP